MFILQLLLSLLLLQKKNIRMSSISYIVIKLVPFTMVNLCIPEWPVAVALVDSGWWMIMVKLLSLLCCLPLNIKHSSDLNDLNLDGHFEKLIADENADDDADDIVVVVDHVNCLQSCCGHQSWKEEN